MLLKGEGSSYSHNPVHSIPRSASELVLTLRNNIDTSVPKYQEQMTI